MNDEDAPAKRTPTQVMAELVMRRRAGQSGVNAVTSGPEIKRAERAAAARSASKSKPAPRK